MKFQSMIRKGLVFAGITAAIALLPGSAKSQEITNTEFNDGPNVVAFAQPTATDQSAAAVSPALPASQAMKASETIIAATQQAQQTSKRMIWAGASLIWVVAIGIYAFGPLKGLVRELRALRNSRVSTYSA